MIMIRVLNTTNNEETEPFVIAVDVLLKVMHQLRTVDITIMIIMYELQIK